MDKLKLSQFYDRLKDKTKEVYLSVTNNNDVCAFGILTDSDARSLSYVFNTKKHLIDITNEDPDEDPNYYKWILDEWGEDFYDDETKLLGEYLFNLQVEEETLIKHKNNIFNLMTDALLNLKQEGLLDDKDDKFILGFCPSDYDDIDSEIAWISKINSKNNSDEFISYRQSW